MPTSNGTLYNELMALMEDRCQSVFEKVKETATAGVNDSSLMAVLETIKCYPAESIRTTLTSLSCEAVGGNPEAAQDACLMFALSSVGIGIHDDIVDKSTHKRFNKTFLGLHGQDKALLIGDLLIVKSWATVKELIKKTSQPITINNILKVYEKTAIKQCEAELKGLSYRRKLESNIEEYNEVLWKINADLEACTAIGAIIGGASEKETRSLAEFGKRLGFMFALTDDVMDTLNLKGNLPRRIEYESVPLPIHYAASTSKENRQKIEGLIKKTPLTPSDAKELVNICFETEAFTYIRERASQNKAEAIQTLQILYPSTSMERLALIMRKAFEDLDSLIC